MKLVLEDDLAEVMQRLVFEYWYLNGEAMPATVQRDISVLLVKARLLVERAGKK